MNSNWRAVAMYAFAIFLVPSVSCAQEAKIIVGVDVSSDKSSKPQMESCLKRELRKIRDVEVGTYGDSSNTFDVSVVLVKDKTKSGATQGYSMSLVVVSYLGAGNADVVLSDSIKADAHMRNYIASFLRLEQHSLLADPSLQSICSKGVADIDSDVLARHRQAVRRLNKLQEKK